MVSVRVEDDLRIVPLWINGESIKSDPEITFRVHSAKQQRDVCTAHSADQAHAIEACQVAMTAFGSWKRTTAAFRRDLILRAASILESYRTEIVALQVEETSCEASWASFNLHYGLENMREIAGCITSCYGELPRLQCETNLAMVMKEPVGPSLLISPYVSITWRTPSSQLMT